MRSLWRVVLISLVVFTGSFGLSACESSADAKEGPMPSLVGVQLDKALDQLKPLKIKEAKAVDRESDRSIIVESNWVVVDQNPAVDTPLTGQEVELGVLKKHEATTTTSSTTSSVVPIQTTVAASPTTAVTPTSTITTTKATATTTRLPVQTTAAPTTTAPAPSSRVVTPGAFCSGEGSIGYTKTGKTMRCSYKDGDDRLRWRAA